MKRIIEYLEKSDIVDLTDEFIKSDILMIMFPSISKEEVLLLVDEVISFELESDEQNLVFLHKTYVNHELISIPKIVSFDDMVKNKFLIKPLDEVSLGKILNSYVASNSCTPYQIKTILIYVLHVALIALWGDQIFGINNVNLEVETEMNFNESTFRMVSLRERNLIQKVEEAVKELDYYYLSMELDELIVEWNACCN